MRALIVLLLLCSAVVTYAQQTHVMVMEIKSEIDPRMHRYVELAIEHAEDTKADIVIIEMDTYGGVLTDAKEIVDILTRYKKPLWVFINSDAASAGALISIACDSIYMAEGASIGAATVVTGDTGEAAPDKYQSYMRGIMRSTAEKNGRDPRIAEAMVDQDLEVDSISPAGQVITFSTSEAIQYGYCEGQVSSIDEILEKNQVENYTIDHFHLSAVDKVIAFFVNPFISGILILVIIGGLYFELQSPGVGFPGAAALAALILYLVPYYLNGLADNWEILALFIGFGLLAAEIFVIPGFGVAGITGIGLIIMSLILIMLNNDVFDFQFVPTTDVILASTVTICGAIGGLALLFVGGSRLLRSKAFQRIALSETQDRTQGYTSRFIAEPMKGKTGIAYTVLRPSGRVKIGDQIYDAYTRGDYIEKDTSIEVVNDEGVSLLVRVASTPSSTTPPPVVPAEG